MNQNEYDALVMAQRAAEDAHDKIKAEKGAWVKERLDALHAQASELFDAEISKLGQEAWDARFKLEAATVVRNMADTGWLPVGTVVVKVQRGYSGFYGRKDKQLRGIVEVWSVDSARPAKGWPPRNGDVVVRLLKADGTPGLKYERLYTGYNAEKGNVRQGWGPVAAKEEVAA